MKLNRTALAILSTLSMAGVVTHEAAAQAYPNRPIRIIVPFAPGGGIDFTARLIAQRLNEAMGQSVIVDNRTGGGGIVGSEVAVKSPADGYTLLAVPISHAVNISLAPKLSFNPVTDFAHIVQIASAPNVVLVHPSVPAKTSADLVRLAKAKPGSLAFASSGNGSSTHLATELFKMLAKIEMLHVPYKGGGPALTDLLGGQVSMYFGSLPASMPHLRSGRLRGLGVTSKVRAATLPDMPTVAESGVHGYEYVGWYGLLAPAGTPAAVVTRLNAEVNKILKTPAFAEKLAADGAEPVGGTPDEFANFVKAEITKWGSVVKHAKISTD